MGGGFFGFLGLKRQQRRKGHEPRKTTELRQSRRRDGEEPRPKQVQARGEMEVCERKVRRTDEDHGRWVSGLDVDDKAKEFIDRVRRRINSDQLYEAV